MAVRNNLVKLMGEKQAKSGEIVNLMKVAAESGVRHNILTRWARQEITRFDAPVVERLCDYFNCEPGDLLYIERDKTKAS